MRLTYIKDDALISVDGVSVSGVDVSDIDAGISALQWYGTYGEIEYCNVFDGARVHKPENTVFTDVTFVQTLAVKFNHRKEVVDEEERAALAADAKKQQELDSAPKNIPTTVA